MQVRHRDRKHLARPVRRSSLRSFFENEIDVDNFAGGGGASTALELATGRAPAIAINHDPEALAMHAANHPQTEHFCESVWQVDPVAACRGRAVGHAWFSPDCKHFSKSKGGKPRNQKIRGLAWVAVRWAHAVQPRVIFLENVEEFQDWGPLHKEHHAKCCPTIKGEDVICSRKGCQWGKPIKARKGQTFRAFVRKLESYGYTVDWRLVRACDFGAPTTRRRLFLVARCDGQAIRWPEPTHGGLPGQAPVRTAAECIDWTLPCPSIFEPGRDLVAATMRRIARGAHTFVLKSPRPYIVTMRGTESSHIDSSARGLDEPIRTISAAGTHHALVVPYLVHRSNGERPGQAPRIYDPQKPLGCIVAGGLKHAVCAAFLVKHYGGHESTTGGTSLDKAIDTITAQDHHSLTAAFLVRYNRTGIPQAMDVPAPTLTTRDRLALVESELAPQPLTPAQVAGARRVAAFLREHGYKVDGEFATVTVEGAEYVVVDIGMRMLSPPELFKAQGFPDDYVIAPVFKGKPLTKTAQIRMCGNSVSPPPAIAIVRAQIQAAA